MLKSRSLIILTLLSWISMPAAHAKLRVVATLPNLADIATQVGGDQADVTALTKGTADPHFVDPKPSLVLQLNRADALIVEGMELEVGWLPPLLTGSRNGKIQTGSEGYIDASQFIDAKEVPQGKIDRSMGDVHPGGNPHYTLDPRNGIKIARGLAERFGKLDSSNAEAYKKRADAYIKQIEAKIPEWEKALASLKGKSVATYHKSWIYFDDWIGAKEAGYIEPKPGIPPSPDHIVSLTRSLKDRGVKLILIEPYHPRQSADQVAERIGAKVYMLPTEVGGAEGVKSYIGVFDEIVKRLKGATG